MKTIDDTLGTYINKVEPKDGMFSRARICVEEDLEKGFPEVVQLTLDNWTHIQPVDYEQLLFKCKQCHEYGNFAKHCPKNIAPE